MIPALPSHVTPDSGRLDQLRAKAQELEAVFLSEMLAHAGLGTQTSAFGGGIGEQQFSSFLRQEQAKAMVQQGGIGLSEALFHVLAQREGLIEGSQFAGGVTDDKA